MQIRFILIRVQRAISIKYTLNNINIFIFLRAFIHEYWYCVKKLESEGQFIRSLLESSQ